MSVEKKNKKVDLEALNSAFMKIPKVNTATARDLLDLGFTESYQLIGRSPEVLYEEITRIKLDVPKDRLGYFRYIVAYVEVPEEERKAVNFYAFTQL